MKKLLMTAVAIVGFAGAASAADPVVGTWQTQVDDGAYAYVKISPCGAKLCGTIARTFRDGAEFNSDTKGKPIVWDMVSQGGGNYGNGKILQPSTGKVYNSKMQLNGNTLKVSGCVGPICKKQTWARIQ